MSITKTVSEFVVKHGPKILKITGLIGGLGAIYTAVKATPKALDLMYDELCKRDGEPETRIRIQDIPSHFTLKEKLNLTWKCYMKSLCFYAGSLACSISGEAIDVRRNILLRTTCEMTERLFDDYRTEVRKSIGDEKEEEIRSTVESKNTYEKTSSTVIFTSNKVRCKDALSNQIFISSKNDIIAAINKVNALINDDMFATVSELYDELDIPHTIDSDNRGWREHLIYRFDPDFDETGELCLVLTILNDPTSTYDDLYGA